MTWTATILASAVDVANPSVGFAITVQYTNGALTDTRTHRGLGSVSAAAAVIAGQIAMFEDGEANAQAMALGPYAVAPRLTSAQITALQPYFNAALTNQQNADALNAVNVPNPAAQGTVPKPMTVDGILGVLTATELGTLFTNPQATTIRDDVRRQDYEAVGQWASLGLASGQISQASHDAVTAQLQQTVSDPSWPPQVSRAVIEIGRPATLADMALVRGS